MSLTFRQTRYQALYKDVQRLIEDTASIAVRRNVLYMYASPSYRRNWLWGNTKIITPLSHSDIEGRSILLMIAFLIPKK